MTGKVVKARIERFFEEYEQRMNAALRDPPEVDTSKAAESFASYFVAANPNGVMGGANDSTFREHIPRGYELYRSIGTQWMKVLTLTTVPIDDLHYLVKVHWDSSYSKASGNVRIEFVVAYLVQLLDDSPKIFGWVTGDESKVLQDHGLLPPHSSSP